MPRKAAKAQRSNIDQVIAGVLCEETSFVISARLRAETPHFSVQARC